MEKSKIVEILKDFKKEDVERFASYIVKLSRDEKSAFVNKYSEESLCELFRRVEAE
jgi:phosphoribosyl-ATP pyrophosphohydrolase